MEPKEKWINDTLESINGIQAAEANLYTYNKVWDKLQNRTSKVSYLQPKALYKYAACLILFIGLNIFTIIHFNKSTASSQDSKSVFANEYFSYINNI